MSTQTQTDTLNLNVAVVGMGYVGAVSAAALAALAAQQCNVVGVEVHPKKLQMLRNGQSPINEPGLHELIDAATQSGKLLATDDLATAVRESDVVLICVGTPSDADGRVDLTAMERVTDQIASALRDRTKPCVVAIRSTVPPGTVRDVITPKLRAAYPCVAVCHHPEFLREGSALKDWKRPPMIVWGCDDRDNETVSLAMERMYLGVPAPRLAIGPMESEMIKYACNIYHAVKIDFANEIGSIASACGADADAVMAAFCQDTKLNISKAYLRPGFAFGGSCLPKDTRAMIAQGAQAGLKLPLIEAVLQSNQAHLSRQVDRVLECGRVPTLLLGLSFKTGTDDLRESPMIELAERLLGKGIPLRIYDPDLMPDKLVGANAAYVQEHLPHLKMLLCDDLAQATTHADTVVIAKQVGELDEVSLSGKSIIDLTCATPAVTKTDSVQRRSA